MNNYLYRWHQGYTNMIGDIYMQQVYKMILLYTDMYILTVHNKTPSNMDYFICWMWVYILRGGGTFSDMITRWVDFCPCS